jgi:GAF domain-containing protein
MPTPTNIAEALAEAARTIDATRSIDDTLRAIVDSARDNLPGFEHVGISTVERDGRIQTRAATDDLVNRLDDLQYGLDEGPCVDALHEPDVVAAPNIREDHRWPRYVAEAVRSTGLRSQLAVKLFLDEDGTLGGLNIYSTRDDSISEEAIEIARLYATHAAIALGHAKMSDQLHAALRSSRTIGQAIGIIMERYQLDADRAFGFLTRASSTSNTKLRVVAQEVVESVGRRGSSSPVAGPGGHHDHDDPGGA